ncbi:5-hydroxytryptamine receptor 1-like [Vanessa cardui]|uniref:5-hydroxytryptamine receptor 1-like n=1 Tax=Vanessa cardui TaxID=171605 RepID=UPI001F13E540|nr:5-hydroxytryptamine receptor 1-like [Vanessa cardui]
MAAQNHNFHCSRPSFVTLPSCLLILVSLLLQADFAFSIDYNDSNLSGYNNTNPNTTINWTLYDTNTTLLKNSHIKHTKYSTLVTVLLTAVFMIVIFGTIVGNILVCVAVCLVRKLRRPSNYLIVSLAVSDLCVATMVMPVAMVYDLMGSWPFGPVVCDFWVSSDVLSCAASILNLCMISVDRYYAITKPLEYGVKRTPKRMLFCVFIVWMSAAFISLPPVLILGNEKTETSCSVSQNQGYQIYATFGSFYLPLTVMVVVYYKIFSAARKIVKDERRAQSHLETHCYLEINVKNGGAAEAKLLGSQPAQPPPPTRGSTASTNTTCSIDKTESSIGRCFTGQRKSNESQCPMLQPKTPTKPIHTINRPNSQMGPVPEIKHPPKENRRRQSSESSNKLNTSRIRSSLSSFAQKSHFAKDLLQPTHSPHQKKLRFQLAKERKASTTLGIIMSAFIICWLPFFVLALIRPFVNEDTIPDAVSALFLWLGYINSLLNPIIYATLNRDFRKPFQEILFFRCSNLNHMMREEFYHSQYGGPDQHYCVNNSSSKLANYEEGVEIVSAVDREETKASESFL